MIRRSFNAFLTEFFLDFVSKLLYLFKFATYCLCESITGFVWRDSGSVARGHSTCATVSWLTQPARTDEMLNVNVRCTERSPGYARLETGINLNRRE